MFVFQYTTSEYAEDRTAVKEAESNSPQTKLLCIIGLGGGKWCALDGVFVGHSVDSWTEVKAGLGFGGVGRVKLTEKAVISLAGRCMLAEGD